MRPTCTLLTLVLILLPTLLFPQSPTQPATLIILDSRDSYFWDYRVRYYDETGKEVATQKQCEVVRLTLTPGPHKFWSNKDKKKKITVNAVAGDIYYAAGGLKVQLPSAMWFEFDLITLDDAEARAKKCHLPPSALGVELPINKPNP